VCRKSQTLNFWKGREYTFSLVQHQLLITHTCLPMMPVPGNTILLALNPPARTARRWCPVCNPVRWARGRSRTQPVWFKWPFMHVKETKISKLRQEVEANVFTRTVNLFPSKRLQMSQENASKEKQRIRSCHRERLTTYATAVAEEDANGREEDGQEHLHERCGRHGFTHSLPLLFWRLCVSGTAAHRLIHTDRTAEPVL
jgi:hypothetical protein